MKGALQQHLDAFTERNTFLYAALGFMSFAELLDELVDACSTRADAAGNEVPSPPDWALDLVLGAVSIRRRLAQIVIAAAASAEVESSNAPARAGQKSILR
jgi:hypothetical protein